MKIILKKSKEVQHAGGGKSIYGSKLPIEAPDKLAQQWIDEGLAIRAPSSSKGAAEPLDSPPLPTVAEGEPEPVEPPDEAPRPRRRRKKD